ncbi:MAG TPA: helicase HerA-like domain-containing protein [Ignavibacteriaceae bacterium]
MIKKSSLVKKHNELIDRESSYEILNKKIEQITQVKEAKEATQ